MNNKEKTIEELITKLNFYIFLVLNSILEEEEKENITANLESTFELFDEVLDKVQEKTGVDYIREVYDEVDRIKTEVLAEYKNRTNMANSLCYLIGSNSEMEDNFTILSRIAILLAIAELKEIKIDF